jgi:hypothetical protein
MSEQVEPASPEQIDDFLRWLTTEAGYSLWRYHEPSRQFVPAVNAFYKIIAAYTGVTEHDLFVADRARQVPVDEQ